MQLIVRLVFCLLLVSGVFFLTTSNLKAVESSSSTKIGVVVPLTGKLAEIGSCLKNMTQLASELADEANRVTFVFEDDAFIPRLTVSAVRKLIDHDNVDELIIFGSSTALAVAPIVERYQIPTIAIATSPEPVKNSKVMFRHYISSEQQANLMAKKLSGTGKKRVALVATEHEPLLEVLGSLERRLGDRIVFSETVLPGEASLGSLASKLLANEPDTVGLLLLPPELSLLPRRLRELGYDGSFFSSSALENRAVVENASDALEGAWYVTLDDRGAVDLKGRYKEQYGENFVPEGLNAHDAALLFIRASRAKSINDYLQSVSTFEGALGEYGMGSMNSFEVPVAVKRIKEGSFVHTER